MKATIRALGFVSLFLSAQAFAIEPAKTPSERVDNGLENVKEGTKEVAKGLQTTAEAAGKTATEVTQKVGRSIKAATCPIVGDRKTKLYYAKDSKSYLQVLDGQKYFEDDDRSCFMTEDAARGEGYVRSAN